MLPRRGTSVPLDNWHVETVRIWQKFPPERNCILLLRNTWMWQSRLQGKFSWKQNKANKMPLIWMTLTIWRLPFCWIWCEARRVPPFTLLLCSNNGPICYFTLQLMSHQIISWTGLILYFDQTHRRSTTLVTEKGLVYLFLSDPLYSCLASLSLFAYGRLIINIS